MVERSYQNSFMSYIVNVFVSASVLVLTACSSGQDESLDHTLENVDENLIGNSVNLMQLGIEAMGGTKALGRDKVINITSQGVAFEPHESGDDIESNHNISSKYVSNMTALLSGEKINIEYRTDFVFPFPYNGAATMVINGKEGSVYGIDSFASRFFGLTLPRPMYSRRLEALSKSLLMGNPYMLMSRMLGQIGIDSEPVDNNYEITLDDALPPVKVELDPKSGLPVRASTIERDYLFGDVVYKVDFRQWKAVDGGIYPSTIDHSLDGFTIRAENVTEVSFGTHKVDEFTFVISSKRNTYLSIENPHIIVNGYDSEEGRRGLEASQWSMRMLSLGFSHDLPVDDVVITKENKSRNRTIKVDGNVYIIEGNTELLNYASMIVDTAKGIYVIEPVLHGYRSKVVIDALKKRFHGKPLLGIIATHHHMDHIGGLREYAAETGKVFIGVGAYEFVEKAITKKNNLFTDALDSYEGEVEIVTVSDRLSLGEGNDAFEVISFPTSHTHDDMLVIYFPSIKALAVGDIFNGEMIDAISFFNEDIKNILGNRAKGLQDFITSRGLEVETLLTVHGGAVSVKEIAGFLQ